MSDSFHLIQYADLLLYVMRAEYTDRDMLEFTEEVERDNAQGKLAIVLNDVKIDISLIMVISMDTDTDIIQMMRK